MSSLLYELHRTSIRLWIVIIKVVPYIAARGTFLI